ncbi:uncharacterized protein LOC124941614 [Impatiens glandulifera]|uniref:uncharacterized protein LOC124941614 n=1 Tax=Impatiens glandulifera TaxID=253017 RepID=UPI001FB19AE0|nr:uncharacterized protein LOC124941614 [Impatiens glandulifera]
MLIRARGVPIPPEGVMWHLRVVCGFHNHQLAESMYGHEYPSRLKPMELQFVLDMANSTASREVLNILKQRDPSNTTGIKTIYNAIFTNKSAKRAGLNQVHLLLFVNCPSVLIIDATYKTNEYRSLLLEVVGITSTMRTYSLMLAYLSNEREEQLTWALGTLKKWMLEKGTSLPSVFVSDRDMALINAIEICFPTARHILCIWHINQCWSYHHKWKVMREEYRRFQGALNYLWETWLHSYKERFVSAWIDTCMHLGSNSSQRCRISLQAMEFINAELKCAEEASHQLAGKCNCSIKIIYGLPCKHDLAHYRFLSIPIPIQSINAHWRRLSMNGHEYHDDRARANRTSKVIEILYGMDPQMREQMIDRFFNIADPSQSTVRAPSVEKRSNLNTR